MKNVTKKEMTKAIMSEDVNNIFKFSKKLQTSVAAFIDKYAPSARANRRAWRAVMDAQSKHAYERSLYERSEFSRGDVLREIRQNVEIWRSDKFRYAKRVYLFDNYLVLASPLYGLKDYNKSVVLLRAGNEAFCERVCQMCDTLFFS